MSQTHRDYILSFVDRIEGLLQAFLSWKALPSDHSRCLHYARNRLALWRCQDCSFGLLLCHQCICTIYHQDPMHRIKQWTGTYFRPAALWEVGSYLLIQHQNGVLCPTLQFQQHYLEEFETSKDNAKQQEVEESDLQYNLAHMQPTSTADTNLKMQENQVEAGGPEYAAELKDNTNFEKFLNNLYEHPSDPVDGLAFDDSILSKSPPIDDEADDTAEVVDAKSDILNFLCYLEILTGHSNSLQAPSQHLHRQSPAASIPNVDVLNNSYVRIVHTNGIHHLAMVTCTCHGANCLPLELVTCCLLPASFDRICTLFSMQVLNSFWLANLELKALAYQFYQLLCHLTWPMAPAKVVDLYNKFCRMSQLWRWMKKLKWSGVGNTGGNAIDVFPGQLSNYCPACPQLSINVPEDWKDDPNR